MIEFLFKVWLISWIIVLLVWFLFQCKSWQRCRIYPTHIWQTRGVNQWGGVTYRVCLNCRKAEKRVNNLNEPDRYEECNPIPYLDDQFDENDEYIYPKK